MHREPKKPKNPLFPDNEQENAPKADCLQLLFLLKKTELLVFLQIYTLLKIQ